jgi:hypothetical protein
MEKHSAGTVFFVVGLLTLVVILVDEPMIRAALAFVPALLLAQRALAATTTGDGRDGASAQTEEERREDSISRDHLDQFLKQFREFYSTCHLLGAGTIDSEEALQRTARTERDLNTLMADVLAATREKATNPGP